MARSNKAAATNPPAPTTGRTVLAMTADPGIVEAGVQQAHDAVSGFAERSREAEALGEDDRDDEPAAGGPLPPPETFDPLTTGEAPVAPPAAAPAPAPGKAEKKPAGQGKPRQTKTPTAKPRAGKSDTAPPAADPAPSAPAPVLPSSGHFRQVNRPGKTPPAAVAATPAPRQPRTLQTLRAPVVPPPTPEGQPEPVAQEVLIRIPPLYELPSRAYCAPHIELRMSPEQARMARRLAFGMECETEGSQKCSPAAAVLNLLQQLVDAEKDATRRRPAAA